MQWRIYNDKSHGMGIGLYLLVHTYCTPMSFVIYIPANARRYLSHCRQMTKGLTEFGGTILRLHPRGISCDLRIIFPTAPVLSLTHGKSTLESMQESWDISICACAGISLSMYPHILLAVGLLLLCHRMCPYTD